MPVQQEVFIPLEGGANINTAEGFQIVPTEKDAETSEEVNERMEKSLMDNQTVIESVRTKVARMTAAAKENQAAIQRVRQRVAEIKAQKAK